MNDKLITLLGLDKFFKSNIRENAIAIFTPKYATQNLGDQIIAEAVQSHLLELFPKKFFIEFSSHSGIRNIALKMYNECLFRFIGGANLFMPNARLCCNILDVPTYEAWKYHKGIFIGVGCHRYSSKHNIWAKILYPTLMDEHYLHSVRDSYTEMKVRQIGINNVINTGCPTTWNLSNELISKIPPRKSKNVVFTINSSSCNPKMDKYLITTLINMYNSVFFFPQGIEDITYLSSLEINNNKISFLPQNLASYDRLLSDGNIDYVGTRLHGGIRALQHGIHTIIIEIDNRAKEINKDINLLTIDINNLCEQLTTVIEEHPQIQLHILEKNILIWKKQFCQ